jgi:hypothetical protein
MTEAQGWMVVVELYIICMFLLGNFFFSRRR